MRMSLRSFLAVSAVTLIAACNPNIGGTPDYETSQEKADRARGRITGDEGIVLFGGSRRRGQEEGGGGLAVNSFLWRASLDTVSFMPLASADPFGGVIITDWYSSPDTPGERFKVTLYILDRQLRADGIRAAVFRQVRDGSGWSDARVDARTNADMENAILTRARQMRLETAATTTR